MNRQTLGLMLAAIAAACSACVALPVTTADLKGSLGYKLVIDNGRATISGQALAPASLLSTQASSLVAGPNNTQLVNEAPLAGVTIDAVDENGHADGSVLPVQTDTTGHYQIRGLQIGKASFLRASFQNTSQQPRFLYSYVRPDTMLVCLDDSLPATIAAYFIANSAGNLPLFNMKGLGPVPGLIRAKLPSALTSAPASYRSVLATTDEATIHQFMDDMASAPTPKGPFPTRAKALMDGLLADVAVKKALDAAVDTALDVSFTIQDLGLNTAPYPNEQDKVHLMIGHSTVMWSLPSHYQSVSFFLNNVKVGDGAFKAGQWSATLDTAQQPDGAYVLNAVGAPNAAGGKPAAANAFVYVKNHLPGDAPCTAPR